MIPNNAPNSASPEMTESSDDRLDIKGPRPSVTRISRKAVLLAGVFGAALGLVVLMLGFGDHNAPRKEGAPDENAIRPSGPIESVKDLPRDYSFDVTRMPGSYEGSPRQSTTAPAAVHPTSPSMQDQAVAQAIRDLAEQRRNCWSSSRKSSRLRSIRRCCLAAQSRQRPLRQQDQRPCQRW